MRFKISLFLFLVVMVTPCFAAPSVSSTSGNGTTVTISGSSFGAKSTAAPMKWDDFDDGVNGNGVETNGYWSVDGDTPPEYNNDNLRTGSGLNLECYLTSLQDLMYKDSLDFSSGYIYADWWIKYNGGSGDDWYQVKCMRVCKGGDTWDGQTIANFNWQSNDRTNKWFYFQVRYENADSSIGTSNVTINPITEDVWTHMQLVIKNSSVGSSDGEIYIYKDGALTGSDSSVLLRTQNVEYDCIRFGEYIGNGGNSTTLYYDDIYFDDSWARVEIGNNSDYDSCTHREIQIPTAWSSSEITATLNFGSFSSGGTAYLFVIDSDGNVSTGHEISTTTGTSSSTTGDPGEIGVSISSSSGTFSDGETVTLYGSNFGSHGDNDIGSENYLCVAWDDFESGNTDDIFSVSGDTLIASDDQRTNSSYSIKIGNASTTSDDASDGVYIDSYTSNDGYYWTFWMRYDDAMSYGSGSQTKFTRIWHGTTGGSDNYPNMMAIHNNGEFAVDIELVSGDRETITSDNDYFADSQWHQIEIWLKPSSGIGNTDGERKVWLDGSLVIDETLQTDNAGNNSFDGLWAVHDYISNRSGKFYYDDVYMDFTQARVMVGNNSDFASCTHKEICTPVNWDSDEVTVIFNQGSFADSDDAYMFVVDSDGTASIGYMIEIASSGGSNPDPTPEPIPLPAPFSGINIHGDLYINTLFIGSEFGGTSGQIENLNLSYDFASDIDGWSEVVDTNNSHTVSQASGKLSIASTSTDDWHYCYVDNENTYDGDKIEFSADIVNSTNDTDVVGGGIAIYYDYGVGGSSRDDDNCIEVYTRDLAGQYLVLRQKYNDSDYVFGTYNADGFYGTTFSLKIIRNGDDIEVYVDGTKKIDYTLTATDKSRITGDAIQLRSLKKYNANTVTFDDVVIKTGTNVGTTATDFTQDANCVGAWYMNSGGSEIDRSGNSATLTESSGDDIPTSTDVPSGYSGNSRDFESGDADVIEMNDGGSTDVSGANQAFSFACWVKAETVGTQSWYVLSKYDTGADQRQYALYINSTPAFQFNISYDGDNRGNCVGGTTISAGTWYHVACVYDDTDMRLYVNGSLDSNSSDNPLTFSSGIFDGTSKFALGGRYSSGAITGNYDGLIDEVIMFDRALSATEIEEIYTDGIDGTKGSND
jgi:hypothetical protein